MNIGIKISSEIESIIKEKGSEEGGKKISSDLLPAARELDNTLGELEHDLDRVKNKMHESGLDSEFREIKSELRSRLSSALI